jgi:peptide/nickel transport system ATP-binding protein
MNRTPIASAVGLTLDYALGDRWLNVLHDVTLHILPDEIHGLVGESGSGKSTLALALMRYLASNARISSGRVLLDGVDLLDKSPDAMRDVWGRQIAYVPQDALAALNPSHPIGAQIAEIGQRHLGYTRRAALEAAIAMLRAVGIPDPETAARRYPHQLSGGMQQRVTIAMALLTQPRLLVLDEPTTALDVTTQAVIVDLFRDLIRSQRTAALYVSHDLGVIAGLCDWVTVLYAGEVMASASVHDLFTRPLHPYTIALLSSLPRPLRGSETRLPTIPGIAPSLTDRPRGCPFAPRCSLALPACHDEKPPLEQVSGGGQDVRARWIKCHRWREIAAGEVRIDMIPTEGGADAAPREQIVLKADRLYKIYDQPGITDRLLMTGKRPIRALDDVSLHVRGRSTVGVVGESGSGKTTLARIIIGLETGDEGMLELLDMPLDARLGARPRPALRALQMVFQNPNAALNPHIRIGAQIARAVRLLTDTAMTRDAVHERVIALLEAVRLPADYADRYPTALSGGEKQRAAIARAFAANPALVVADEPTSALDVSVQSVILNLLKDLRAQNGTSYLLISHNLDAVAYLADWIVVLYLGEVVEQGTVEQVYGAPSHPYTEALLSAIPVPDPTDQRKHIRLRGEPPSPRSLPIGCRFHTRCARKLGAVCEQAAPPMQQTEDGHMIRCHIPIAELAVVQAADSAGGRA